MDDNDGLSVMLKKCHSADANALLPHGVATLLLHVQGDPFNVSNFLAVIHSTQESGMRPVTVTLLPFSLIIPLCMKNLPAQFICSGFLSYICHRAICQHRITLSSPLLPIHL
jgi:hypothetical protein